jgi:hypothetical protein
MMPRIIKIVVLALALLAPLGAAVSAQAVNNGVITGETGAGHTSSFITRR